VAVLSLSRFAVSLLLIFHAPTNRVQSTNPQPSPWAVGGVLLIGLLIEVGRTERDEKELSALTVSHTVVHGVSSGTISSSTNKMPDGQRKGEFEEEIE
jgi:hypothetical protein